MLKIPSAPFKLGTKVHELGENHPSFVCIRPSILCVNKRMDTKELEFKSITVEYPRNSMQFN